MQRTWRGECLWRLGRAGRGGRPLDQQRGHRGRRAGARAATAAPARAARRPARGGRRPGSRAGEEVGCSGAGRRAGSCCNQWERGRAGETEVGVTSEAAQADRRTGSSCGEAQNWRGRGCLGAQRPPVEDKRLGRDCQESQQCRRGQRRPPRPGSGGPQTRTQWSPPPGLGSTWPGPSPPRRDPTQNAREHRSEKCRS